MNKAILVGNLVRDPEQRTTPSGTAVTTFTVAVQRKFKDADGKYQSDFINCVAWRGTAEFVGKYFAKGKKIGLVGSIQTRSYDDKNGNKRYVTEVVADDVEFVENKGASAPGDANGNDLDMSDFEPLDEASLPF